MPSTRPSKQSPRSSSASRSKAPQLPKDLLTVADIPREKIGDLIRLAKKLKAGHGKGRPTFPLKGKTLGLIFEKPSTRTRVSFEAGMNQLGGQALFLASEKIQLSRGESLADTAKVLSRYVDGLVVRTFNQSALEEWALHTYGDGIIDYLDLCPTQSETFNNYQDKDGCPDKFTSTLDTDMDGIFDVIDDCPQIPETYNKFQDSDGCPDSVSDDLTTYQFPDTDGDGIEDRKDQCINLPENYNDYTDWDGCPDLEGAESTISPRTDSDGDGFYDAIDSCPTNPETWNKYDDNDGCPDVAPEQKRFVHDDDLDDIINDEDSCPLEPEDYDGDRDLDGCPDP